MGLRKVLPEHYLAADTKDAVKLGKGRLGTIAIFILGRLIAPANKVPAWPRAACGCHIRDAPTRLAI